MEGDAGGGRGALSPAEVQRFSFQSGPVGGETPARPAQRRSFRVKLVVRLPRPVIQFGRIVDTDRTYSHILGGIGSGNRERSECRESVRTATLRKQLVQLPHGHPMNTGIGATCGK